MMQPRSLSTGAIAGVSLAGGAMFLALTTIIVCLSRAILRHKRASTDVENSGSLAQEFQDESIGHANATRPRRLLRRGVNAPYSGANGWSSLSSRENVQHFPLPLRLPSYVNKSRKSGLKSVHPLSRSWKPAFAGRLMSLKALRSSRLSTVNEAAPLTAPMMAGDVPMSPDTIEQPLNSAELLAREQPVHGRNTSLQEQLAEEGTWQNPRSISIQAPAPLVVRKGSAAIDRMTAPSRIQRSKSTTSVLMRAQQSSSHWQGKHGTRPQMHSRSISLCSHYSGLAPNGPVPPLPLALIYKSQNERNMLQTDCSPSRYSAASYESGGSSILRMGSSPRTVRDRSASLMLSPSGRWKPYSTTNPRPVRDTMAFCGPPRMHRHQASIRSSMALYSVNSSPDHTSVRNNSPSSLVSGSLRIRAPEYKHGDSVRTSLAHSMSSVSSHRTTTGDHMTSTPRHSSRYQGSRQGSPVQRRRTSVLRDVSGNQAVPIRHDSQHSTQASSTRSSNGNPFQWDPAPLQSGKPSALKGSPRAKKGHKRQNCVRISLPPTIIRSRSCSPSMNGIKEESPETASPGRLTASVGIGFASTRALPRPPSASKFEPDVKLLRASLTPSSPTLSVGQHCSEIGSRTHRTNRLSTNSSPTRLGSARHSRTSSIFSISNFPIPGEKAAGHSSAYTPVLSISRPSSEWDEGHDNREQLTINHELSPSGLQSFPVAAERSSIPVFSTQSLPLPSPPASRSLVAPNSLAFTFGDPIKSSIREPISPPCSPKTTQAPSFPAPLFSASILAEGNDLFSPTIGPPDEQSLVSGTDSCPPSPTSLLGPRAQPAKSLHRSIITLRRMNSDVSPATREDRRYLRMGREASPALSGFNECVPEEDWGNFESAEPLQQNEIENEYPLTVHGETEDSSVFVVSSPAERSSRVWEDGEKFWEPTEPHKAGTDTIAGPSVAGLAATPKATV